MMRNDNSAALDRRAAGQQLYFYGILPLASSKKRRVSRFLWKSKQPIPSRESIEFFCMDSWKTKIENRKSEARTGVTGPLGSALALTCWD